MATIMDSHPVEIPPLAVPGFLTVPVEGCYGVVIFAHGSGSSRMSPRNTYVAQELNKAGLGTLLFDLLLLDEANDREKIFDISLMTGRLAHAVKWLKEGNATAGAPLGLFSAGTASAAALNVAAQETDVIQAVVSHGGRPDLSHSLPAVKAPTLLIVGDREPPVIEINKEALKELTCVKKIEVIPNATNLLEQEGMLDDVIEMAKTWFVRHLTGRDNIVL